MVGNNRGFSLLEMVTASAMLAGVSLVSVQIMTSQDKSAKNTNLDGEITQTIQSITMLVNNENSCKSTFVTPKLSPSNSTNINIKDSKGTTKYNIGKNIAGKKLTITGLKLKRNYTPAGMYAQNTIKVLPCEYISMNAPTRTLMEFSYRWKDNKYCKSKCLQKSWGIPPDDQPFEKSCDPSIPGGHHCLCLDTSKVHQPTVSESWVEVSIKKKISPRKFKTITKKVFVNLFYDSSQKVSSCFTSQSESTQSALEATCASLGTSYNPTTKKCGKPNLRFSDKLCNEDGGNCKTLQEIFTIFRKKLICDAQRPAAVSDHTKMQRIAGVPVFNGLDTCTIPYTETVLLTKSVPGYDTKLGCLSVIGGGVSKWSKSPSCPKQCSNAGHDGWYDYSANDDDNYMAWCWDGDTRGKQCLCKTKATTQTYWSDATAKSETCRPELVNNTCPR